MTSILLPDQLAARWPPRIDRFAVLRAKGQMY